MVSRHLMEIVIKAIDQTKDVANQVENNFKKIGSTANSSMEATSKATNQVASSFEKINQVMNVSRGNLENMGFKAKSSFATLSNAQKRALLDLNNLNQKCSSTREELSSIGTTGYNAFLQLSVSSKTALTNWNSMSQSTLKWADHMKLAQTYTKGFGVDIDSLKGKILVVGNAIQSSLGSKFESIKTKVNGVARVIKTGLSNALSSVKSKVESVASSFSGLGGVISAVIGAVGMASVEELTIGLAMTREQVSSLVQATWHLDEVTKGAVKTSKEYMDYMDEMTNHSLVSLNDLSQAMNTIRMATNITNSEAVKLTQVVNDIGQAAILMGKDSSESIALMQAVGYGLNGQFEILKNNFGITATKLKELGWKGKANDVKGYINALQKYINTSLDLNGMMDTTTGKLALVKKGFTTAGRQVGEQFIPAINEVLDKLIDVKKTGPELYKLGVYAMGAGSAFATIAPTLAPILQSMGHLYTGTGIAVSGFKVLAGSSSAASKIISNSMVEVLDKEGKVVGTTSTLSKASFNFFQSMSAGNGIIKSLKAGYEGLAISEYIALGPLLLIIAAIIAIGVATYEVGKYFGWWKDLPSMFEAITAGLQRLWSAFINNPDVQATLEAIGEAFKWIGEVLSPVTEAVMGLFPESTTEEFDIVRVIIDTLGYSFHQLALTVGFVAGCIGNTISFFEWLYTSIVNLPNSVYSMIIAFGTFLSQLPVIVWNYLTMTSTSITNAGNNWVSSAISIAYRTVYGVISWICQLPSRVYNYILSVASKILSGGVNWVSNARNLAVRTVSAVMGQISGLPQKVFNEFLQIGNRIRGAVSSAVSAATSFGSSIKNAVLNALHIHSPGIVQLKIATEFENTVGQIKDRVSSAGDSARAFGKSIVNGFSSENISSGLIDSSTLNYEGSSIEPLYNSSQVPLNNPVNGIINNTSNIDRLGGAFNQDSTNNSSFENILTNEKLNMTQITEDVKLNLDNIALNENTKLNQMTNHISASMDTILNKTKNALNQTTLTTDENLIKMQNSTTKTTNGMTKAWNSMKNSIVKASKNIKTQSTTYITGLQNTISGFYNKLQHPGGAGHGSYSHTKSTPKFTSPLGRINSTLASKTFNIDVDYLGNNTTNSNFKGIELRDILNICSEGNCGAGTWEETVKPNVSKIKNTTRNWNMKGPIVAGKYSTGLRFKVKEFENGTPNISFNTFKGMAEDVFSKCNYDFYYNSEKYGNWINAFLGGNMNCSDSSDALIWMARACGLSATKVHGHWNQYGHYWANVEGHKMDTTGWMQRRTWTPSASHAGSPSETPFESLTNAIDNLATDSNTGETFDIYTGETVSSEVTVNGELKVIHEFKNLPDNVSASDVAKIVNDTTSSEDWQKKLANSVAFQSEDNKVKTRLQRKLTRAKGVR